MALVEPWHIKSRAHACTVTGQPFADGDPIFTALFAAPDGGFERRDYSPEGWARLEAAESGDPPPFSFWRTSYRVPEPDDKPQVVAKESAEDLLRRLVEEDEEATENVRYILAVMLERQKLLRETDRQRTPSGILRVYEHRKIGDVLIIRDPDIPLDQVDRVQAEVIAMIESGGRPQDKAAPAGEAGGEGGADGDDAGAQADPAEPAPGAAGGDPDGGGRPDGH